MTKPINQTTPKSQTRQPRGVVKIADRVVPGLVDFRVTNNTYFEADTFDVTYAASALGNAKTSNFETIDASWFMDIETDTFLEVLAGFPADPSSVDPNELTSLVYGRIDDVEYDPAQKTVRLTGRDLAGAFIDAKVPRTFVNQKASDIAAAIADEYGLGGSITVTSGYAGTPSGDAEYSLVHDSGSDWDLLVSLARQSGFVCYVSGQMLYFGPELAESKETYVIQWFNPLDFTDRRAYPTANVSSLTFRRALTITKGVTVTAMSAGIFSKDSIIRSYPTAARSITPGRSSPYGPATQYTYRLRAGLPPADVLAFATSEYKRITSHAMKLSAELPADDLLFPRSSVISVRGTGTPADQTYYPRSVTRTLSEDSGYVMSVEAQNFSPNLAPSEDSPADTLDESPSAAKSEPAIINFPSVLDRTGFGTTDASENFGFALNRTGLGDN